MATYNLFGSTVPSSFDDGGDTSALNLGTAFTANVDGTVNGVRYYRNANQTGSRNGYLWTSGGTLLASVSFSGTTAGWNEASFSTPVEITADTVYIVSYSISGGYYSGDSGFFASSGYTNDPLYALQDGEGGQSNGLYIYASAGTFPNSSFGSSNYYADVIFEPATGDVNSSGTPSSFTLTPVSANAAIGANGTASSLALTAFDGTSVLGTRSSGDPAAFVATALDAAVSIIIDGATSAFSSSPADGNADITASGESATYDLTAFDGTSIYVGSVTSSGDPATYTLSAYDAVTNVIGISTVQAGAAPAALAKSKGRIFVEHKGKRLWFDSAAEAIAFLESQVEQIAMPEPEQIERSIVVKNGVPVVKAKPSLLKATSESRQIQEKINKINSIIQSQFDKIRHKVIMDRIIIQDDNDIAEILGTMFNKNVDVLKSIADSLSNMVEDTRRYSRKTI